MLAQVLGVYVVESGNVHRNTNWILGETKEWGQKEENSEGKQQVRCQGKFYSELRMGGENEFGEATDDHFREHCKCQR